MTATKRIGADLEDQPGRHRLFYFRTTNSFFLHVPQRFFGLRSATPLRHSECICLDLADAHAGQTKITEAAMCVSSLFPLLSPVRCDFAFRECSVGNSSTSAFPG